MRRAFLISGCWIGSLLLSPSGAEAQAPFPSRAAQLVLEVGTDTADDAAQFRVISDVSVTRRGRIYVLDASACTITVLESSGKLVARFGARGTGPVEFTQPSELVVDDTSITVRDRQGTGGRIIRLTPDGKHVTTITLTTDFLRRRTFRAHDGMRVTAIAPSIPMFRVWDSTTPPMTTLTLERPGTTHDDTLFRVRADLSFISTGRGGSAQPTAFGAGGAWAMLGDSVIAHVDGYTGAVQWYSLTVRGATVTRTASLGRTGTPVAAAEIAAEFARIDSSVIRVGETSSGNTQQRGFGPGAALVGTPSLKSIATQALFAADGTLWVGRPDFFRQPVEGVGPKVSGPPNVWTGFPRTGAPFTVEFPVGFTLSAVQGDRAYGFQITEAAQVVAVYAIGSR